MVERFENINVNVSKQKLTLFHVSLKDLWVVNVQSVFTHCLLVPVVCEELVPVPEVGVLLVPADVPAVADQTPLWRCSSRPLLDSFPLWAQERIKKQKWRHCWSQSYKLTRSSNSRTCFLWLRKFITRYSRAQTCYIKKTYLPSPLAFNPIGPADRNATEKNKNNRSCWSWNWDLTSAHSSLSDFWNVSRIHKW